MVSYLLYGFVPLLLFALIDYFSKNLRTAVFTAMAASVLELILMYSTSGTIDPLSAVGFCLLLGLGYASMQTQNRTYIKLQPAIVACIIGVMIGYMQFFSQPVLLRYMPVLEQMVNPEQRALLRDPDAIRFINTLFDWFVLIIFLDAAWIAYAAKRQSQRAWVLVNIFGTFALTALLVVGVLIFQYSQSNSGLPVSVPVVK